MTILRSAAISLQEFFLEQQEGPTSEIKFISTYLPTLCVILIYLLIIRLLQKVSINISRTFFTRLLASYDAVQVLGHALLLYNLLTSDWVRNFHEYCRMGIPEENKDNPRMIIVLLGYFFLKMLDMFSSSFLLLRKNPQKVPCTRVLYDGLVLMSVWFVVRFMPYWHITYFLMLDIVAHIAKHAFKLIAFHLLRMQQKTVAKVLLFVEFSQTFVTVFYTLDALTWNSCNFSLAFCWWLVSQCVFSIISLRPKCCKSKRKERSHSVIEGVYSNDVDEDFNRSSLPFARFGDNNLTKRNITLKVEV